MFTLYTATVLLATTRCNPEEYEAKHAVSNTFVGAAEPYTSVPLTLIGGKDAGDDNNFIYKFIYIHTFYWIGKSLTPCLPI